MSTFCHVMLFSHTDLAWHGSLSVFCWEAVVELTAQKKRAGHLPRPKFQGRTSEQVADAMRAFLWPGEPSGFGRLRPETH